MRKITQAEYDAILRDKRGIKNCPHGDYSEIHRFEANSSFEDCCSFGSWCNFGERCSFGADSDFGANCDFGINCNFRTNCSFGAYCNFGACCSFRALCIFGTVNHFEENCSFGEGCTFGQDCSFGGGCTFERIIKALRMITIGYIGSRKGQTYAFYTKSRIYIRCGCFFGTIEEFEAQVNRRYPKTLAFNDSKYMQHRKEYIGAIEYLKSLK